MELIDKAAVVAEIERLSAYLDSLHEQRIIEKILSFLDTLDVKEVDLEKKEEKLNKAIKLADAMYDAAQRLTTDASRLHKAMQDWWNFKNIEL
jgi:ribosome-binding protein aMBF1 (putative translation factor)